MEDEPKTGSSVKPATVKTSSPKLVGMIISVPFLKEDIFAVE